MLKRKLCSISIASTLFFVTLGTVNAEFQCPSIIPAPQTIEVKKGAFDLNSATKINAEENLKDIKSYLISILPVSLSEKQASGVIVLKINKQLLKKYGKEAYSLNITPKEIEISGASPAGVFYGIQTLRQLLPPATFSPDFTPSQSKAYKIQSLAILDYPRFKWRSLMLDPGRHFITVDETKKMIDVMALQKMNKMHWHLTEDQGWRIEIKKYPKLTEIGSIRSESPKMWERNKGDGKMYGPFFYTQEQIKDIVKYAQKRFITIVPEIEMPGHSIAALAAYPEFGCTGGPYKVRTCWGVEPNIYCAGNNKTYEFLENILTEVMELFPSKFIHIGGDEAPKSQWIKCKKCQAKMKKEGLKNPHELQSYFIRHFDKFLAAHGRRLIGWDEILEGGLAPGAAVMSWRGEKGGIKAAKMNHDVVMSPDSNCYLDYYESKAKGEPESIGGLLPLKKVYSYNPTPATLNQNEAEHILGVQGNLWAEYIWNAKQLEYKAFPRGCAIAEVGWTDPDKKNYSNFIRRLKTHLARFDAMKINYRKLDPIKSK